MFGKNADKPLNKEIVIEKFTELKQQLKQDITIEEIANGFLAIAVEKMANAIKKISLQKGYDLNEYALCCFGGAGGQHACLIAEILGIKKIIIHPFAGVLSAYGIGLADITVIKEKTINLTFELDNLTIIDREYELLENQAHQELKQQTTQELDNVKTKRKIYLKYENTDFNLEIDYTSLPEITEQFNELHQQRYGFIMLDKSLIVDQISVELNYPSQPPQRSNATSLQREEQEKQEKEVPLSKGDIEGLNKPVYKREELKIDRIIKGSALIVESTGTNVIEAGWQGEIDRFGNLILNKQNQEQNRDNNLLIENKNNAQISNVNPNPILLEIFNNLFRSIAEEMGITLQNTSYSVNIKERLDFSCAIFDANGDLVANAPHIPIHLGSMSECVKALIDSMQGNIPPTSTRKQDTTPPTPIKNQDNIPPTPLWKGGLKDEEENNTLSTTLGKGGLCRGDVYLSNNPYNGGTHLPDITVITPVFIGDNSDADFYLASRGHHSDIGGITPGSMPSDSNHIEQEGILLDNFCLVKEGKLQEENLQEILTKAKYPVRNYDQNLADLKAQIAANNKGAKELEKLVDKYSLETIKNYMQFIQDNAEQCVKKAIESLLDGNYTIELDNQAKILVKIKIDRENKTTIIDFTGTSPQQNNNFNAPVSITKAVVLYVFRTLVEDDIPLNAGCLKPITMIIPEGCLLNPQYPCAVVAGNVEISQNVADCLYGALGIMANSQGTMNNFTFGNSQYQYYETICGGSGAGTNHHGTDAVQVHMTNSRLTDPEILEQRFPVRLENFSIRANSGGDGKYKGGNGVIRSIRFLEPMTASVLSSRRVVAPQGLQGGGDGEKGLNYVIRSDGNKEEIASKMTVEMDSNDIFVIETPGGGGFG